VAIDAEVEQTTANQNYEDAEESLNVILDSQINVS